MNAYEKKQADRKARLERAAATAGASAAALSKRASTIAAMIPLGQPILVGHHSERRHRRDAARIGSLHTKAHEARTEATDLSRRAAAVGRAGISSDDPDAIAKLEAELVTLREKQSRMVAVNAALRRTAKAGREAQIEALAAIGWNLRPVDVIARGGFERFELSNSGANIRRIEKRIAELRAKAAAPVREPIVGDGFEIAEDRAANRVQITFATRQPDAVVDALKRRGFRWARSLGVWQRQATAAAWRDAQAAVATIGGSP